MPDEICGIHPQYKAGKFPNHPKLKGCLCHLAWEKYLDENGKRILVEWHSESKDKPYLGSPGKIEEYLTLEPLGSSRMFQEVFARLQPGMNTVLMLYSLGSNAVPSLIGSLFALHTRDILRSNRSVSKVSSKDFRFVVGRAFTPSDIPRLVREFHK